ncbi:hypothetical protein STXM2123_4186 [Streptomyces sp. F-3]|nr:hypothetical protein STXM2123_4186 [Streptomyces sp. F-3]
MHTTGAAQFVRGVRVKLAGDAVGRGILRAMRMIDGSSDNRYH